MFLLVPISQSCKGSTLYILFESSQPDSFADSFAAEYCKTEDSLQVLLINHILEDSLQVLRKFLRHNTPGRILMQRLTAEFKKLVTLSEDK